MKALYLMLFFWAYSYAETPYKADLVIFSYDRPLQLYALLESVQKYISCVGEIRVLLRCSNDVFRNAYQKVFDTFNTVSVKEHEGPHDFKSTFLQVLAELPNEHIFFAVDDIIVIDYIDLNFCIRMMNKFDAYGFYLRMGKNCNKGFPVPHDIPLPRFIYEQDEVCAWQLGGDSSIWSYAHTVDMTVYRKDEIVNDLVNIEYHNPNTFEGYWSGHTAKILHRLGICYDHSHIVNIPLNSVQEGHPNYNMDISVEALLNIFNEGKKIDVQAFYRLKTHNMHMEMQPIFISEK